MYTIKVLLAAFALTLPPGTPTPEIEDCHLKDAALALELLDGDETWLWERNRYEYEEGYSPLETLRDRYQIAKWNEYPPMSDLHRFPILVEQLNAEIAFNVEFQTTVEYRRALTPAHHQVRYDLILDEAESCRKAWTKLRDAKAYQNAPWWVRSRLAELRSMIGYGPYFAGCMPPSVPVWRFSP